MSRPPLSASSASVPRIGPEVITGEAIRTRRLAPPIAVAIRWDSSSPWPGVNQAVTRVPPTWSGCGSPRPLRPTSWFDQSSSKFRRKRSATPLSETIAITFSCRVQESTVQFADPAQTASASRTAYLWCIRSGTPGTGRASIGSSARMSGRGGGGGGRQRGGPRGVDVVEQPRGAAAPTRLSQLAGEERTGGVGEPDVVQRQLEARLRRPEEPGETVGDVVGALPAVGQRDDFDRVHHRRVKSPRWSREGRPPGATLRRWPKRVSPECVGFRTAGEVSRPVVESKTRS